MAVVASSTVAMTSGIPQGIAEIIQQIDDHDGILTISMEALRDAYGKERLGRNIIADIMALLRRLRIEHQPKQLPNDQSKFVRLYRPNSPVGKIIQAAVGWGSRRDQILRDAASTKTVTTLKTVRKTLRETLVELNKALEDY